MPEETGEGKYLIAVGVDMLKVFERFVFHPRPHGVTELANDLHMSKNKIFRIIHTLKMFGYLQKREYSEMYELGPKIWELVRHLSGHDGP